MVLGPVISGWLALHWPLSVPFLLVTVCCLMAVVAAMGMKTTAQARASHKSGDTLSDYQLEEPSDAVNQEPLDNSAHSVLHTDDVSDDDTIIDSPPHTTITAAPLPSTTSDALHMQAADLTSLSNQAPESTTIGPTTELTQRQQLRGYGTVHFLEMSAYAVFLTYFALYAAHIMIGTPLQPVSPSPSQGFLRLPLPHLSVISLIGWAIVCCFVCSACSSLESKLLYF